MRLRWSRRVEASEGGPGKRMRFDADARFVSMNATLGPESRPRIAASL
jgi:hypothetical protein